MSYDIITFGSATQDVFLKSKDFKVREEKKVFSGKGICLSLGSKIPVDDIEFLIGGGGTNTAFTFKNQGFKVAYCGMVGDDPAGYEIERELKRKGILRDFLLFTKKKMTNYSAILGTKNERTILMYRGASEELKEKDIPWPNLKAKWFYLAPLSGKLANVWESILKFAKDRKVRIAVNPGNTQLLLSKAKLKKLLNFADVLIVNQEEAALATGLPYNEEKKIFKTLDNWVDGICIMTKGPLGGIVSDGRYLSRFSVGRGNKQDYVNEANRLLYEYGTLEERRIVDRTGTGDAFGSGFVVGLIKSQESRVKIEDPIKYAIQFGSANATACLQEFGAKNGLLKKRDSIYKFGKIKIKITKLRNN